MTNIWNVVDGYMMSKESHNSLDMTSQVAEFAVPQDHLRSVFFRALPPSQPKKHIVFE